MAAAAPSAKRSFGDMSSSASAVAEPLDLQGKVVTAASVLVYEESATYSFYITQGELKASVEKRGGIWRDAVNSKTDIVIMGDTTREHNKKSADTWSETKKAKAIAKERACERRGNDRPLQVIEFVDFCSRAGLCDGGYHSTGRMSEIELMCLTARFDREKSYKAPGKDRTRMHLLGMTLIPRASDHGGESKPLKGLYGQIMNLIMIEDCHGL